MIYCISDLHGIPLENLKELLQKANFSDDDYLFVLGDVIDRGEHGIEILEWLLVQCNAELLLGNHEAMMLACSFLFDEITEESADNLSGDNINMLADWLSNGGDSTLKALRELNRTSPEKINDIFEYLAEAPVYVTVVAGEKDFLLCHSGIDNFSPDKRLSDYAEDDFLWARPTLETRYFNNAITVFGHTPTGLFEKKYTGKVIKTDTWINIDTGAGSGYSPCLLRLDDLKEFYL